jgi:hypothetical protein
MARRHALLARTPFVLLAGACTQWTSVTPPYPETLPARQQVQVWSASSRLQLHAVRVDSNTLSGVPFTRPPDCDSCRVALALSEIDSLRVGSPEKTGFMLAALPFVALLGLVLGLNIGMNGD